MSDDSDRAARLKRLREETEMLRAEANWLWAKQHKRMVERWWLPPAMIVSAVIAGMAIVALGIVIVKLTRKHPPQVGTVGSTIADGLHMSIVCDAMSCHHRATVDLEALRRERLSHLRFRRAQPLQQMRRRVAATLGSSRADSHRWFARTEKLRSNEALRGGLDHLLREGAAVCRLEKLYDEARQRMPTTVDAALPLPNRGRRFSVADPVNRPVTR